MKNKGLTMFARIVVYLVGAAVVSVCFILIPELVREEGVGKPFNPYLFYSFFAFLYTVATLFFIALYQTHKLLYFIDKGKAFSKQSIKVLRNIKICAVLCSVMFASSVVVLIYVLRIAAPHEDAPPFIMLAFILTFVSSVMAVFVAVLQRLLVDAVAFKSENDLIV